jgi:hypothetical protein
MIEILAMIHKTGYGVNTWDKLKTSSLGDAVGNGEGVLLLCKTHNTSTTTIHPPESRTQHFVTSK